jgi:hypothetical protein
MKKTNNSNPLKTFNDNKAMAYKKAGGEMAAFKKSLIKANDGKIVGPQTEQQAMMSNLMNYQPPVPRANLPSPYADIPRAASIQGLTKNVNTVNSMRSSQGPQAMQARSAAIPNDERRQVINKAYMDAMTNRPKSDTPMMDSLYPKKKGGPVKRKKK